MAQTWDLLPLKPDSTYDIEVCGEADAPLNSGIPLLHTWPTKIHTDSSGIIERVESPFVRADNYKGFEVRKFSDLDLRYFAAACMGSVHLASDAKEDGVDTKITLNQGSTALHIAALHGRLEIIEILRDAGADLDASDQLGWTPIHVAARFEQYQAASLLYELGAKTKAIINGKEIDLKDALS